MDLPSFPEFTGQNTVLSREELLLRETRQTNEYLEILISLMLRAYPNIANEQDRKAFEEARLKRAPIGFKAPESKP
jgi:hypothetical protein